MGSDESACSVADAARWRRWGLAAFWLVIVLGATVRLYQCTRLPAATCDTQRHIIYGHFVLERGLSVAGQTLPEIDPSYKNVCFRFMPYMYPPLALWFFTAVAAIWPSLFFAKLALTGLEAVNTLLLYRLTRSRWLAAVYWVWPLSTWWISREAQYEPLQNIFVLAAFCLLPGRPFLGILMLMLAIQSKVTALALAPYAAWVIFLGVPGSPGIVSMASIPWRRIAPAAAGVAVGALPTLIAKLYYAPIWQFRYWSGRVGASDLYWNPFNIEVRGGAAMDAWGWWHLALTYALLAFLLVAAFRSRYRIAYLAPLVFVVFLLMSHLVQPWYLLALAAFVVPVRERRVVWGVFIVLILMNLEPVARLAGHRMYAEPEYYPQQQLDSAFQSVVK
ncbi:MAG: hypothetical protein WD042_19360 [Phycisphaeraceae bacterium]